MIVYLTTRRHRYPMDHFLAFWAKDLRRTVHCLAYERLFALRSLPLATYIFADIERLSPNGAAEAAEVHAFLAASAPTLRLLNHPTRSCRRYELLRRMREHGVNDFDVYRLSEARTPKRFPVFLRRQEGHEGNLSALLYSSEELTEALNQPSVRDADRNDILIVEFRGQADRRGLHRKYSAFNVGGEIVPRHLHFSRSWMIKTADHVDEETVSEEMTYLETNPHAAELRRVFRIADIDFGRIDYGVVEGRIQVYEINTNPMSLDYFDTLDPRRLPAQELFRRRFVDAIKGVDASCAGALRRPPARGAWRRRAHDALRDLFIRVMSEGLPRLGLRRFQHRLLVNARLAQRRRSARRGRGDR